MNSSDQRSSDERDRVTKTFDWEQRESVQQAVINAIAEVTDQEPTEMEPLSQFINPDSLGSLFAPTPSTPRSSGTVEFQYEDCTVVVTAEGTVTATSHTR
jgi:hypothetical protein